MRWQPGLFIGLFTGSHRHSIRRIIGVIGLVSILCMGLPVLGEVAWAAVLPSAVAVADPANATSPVASAALFEVHCAGCHPGGGNIIRRGKTLKTAALQRNGYDSPLAIAELIRQGKGNMSAFANRLSAGEIEQLAAYVLAQAEHNWH